MEWSSSKLMRIEKCEVSISAGDLRVLLAVLRVWDPEQAQGPMRPGYREHLTPAIVQLMEFEAEATAIRYYPSIVVPGLLRPRAVVRHQPVQHAHPGVP